MVVTKRILSSAGLIGICLTLSSCERWVGISTDELVKRLGPPINIVRSGDVSVYTYVDGLGGSPMRFFVDKDGTVLKWIAQPVSSDLGMASDVGLSPNTVP